MQNVVADHLQRMANSESLELPGSPPKLNAPPPGRPSRPGAERHAGPWKVQFIPRKTIQLAPPRPIIPSRRSRADNN